MLEKLLMMTGLTIPLCNTDEVNCWENRPFTTIWPQNQQKSSKATEVKKTIRKKPRRVRTAFTTDQLRALERVFNRTRYIDRVQREQLAASLNIQDKSIKVWFQNRRMKEKRNSESSCDTSIESYSNAGSPPDSVNQKEKVESSNSMYSAQVNTYNAEAQYQVPHTYYDNHTQYYGTSNIVPPNTTFYYDTNVYQTQYYPHTDYYTEQCTQPNTWACDVNQINYY